MTEDETVGWHHRLNGHEFEHALGDGDGQEAWRAADRGVTKTHTTWQLNNRNNTKERLRVRGAGALLGRCDSAESYTDLSSFLYLQTEKYPC